MPLIKSGINVEGYGVIRFYLHYMPQRESGTERMTDISVIFLFGM